MRELVKLILRLIGYVLIAVFFSPLAAFATMLVVEGAL